MNGQVVAYYRVSTTKQGINGLGMEAQKQAVKKYLVGKDVDLISEFAEVESGKNTNRQELQKALKLCQRTKATLLIAKLDRLARNAGFLLSLRDAGVNFVAVDMPYANRMVIGVMALVAEQERELISERTKAGLAEAKRRGTRLGNPSPRVAIKLAVESNLRRANKFAGELYPVVKQIQKSGVKSLRGIAECLSNRGFKTSNGKLFKAQSVKNLVERAMTPMETGSVA